MGVRNTGPIHTVRVVADTLVDLPFRLSEMDAALFAEWLESRRRDAIQKRAGKDGYRRIRVDAPMQESAHAVVESDAEPEASA